MRDDRWFPSALHCLGQLRYVTFTAEGKCRLHREVFRNSVHRASTFVIEADRAMRMPAKREVYFGDHASIETTVPIGG